MSMLKGAPWLLAHKSMLQINKPQKISLYGKDYVMWKDQTDRVNALPNKYLSKINCIFFDKVLDDYL